MPLIYPHMGLSPRVSVRPEYFWLDPDHELSQGCVFAGLGRFPGGIDYDDAMESINGGSVRGTLTNMDPATDWTLTPWGTPALDLPGDNTKYPSIPLDGRALGKLSVSMWVDQIGPGSDLLTWGPLFVYWRADPAQDRIAFFVGDTYWYTPKDVFAGNLIHWSCTYDGTTWRFFRDGKLVNSRDDDLGSQQGTATTLKLGAGQFGACVERAADLVVHNRDLSPAEVACLANAPSDPTYGGWMCSPRLWFPAAVAGGVVSRKAMILGGGVGMAP